MKCRNPVVRIVALFLVFALIIPCNVNAATIDPLMPCASDYLASYTSYICHMGDGELQIWFRVTGVSRWADIGALTIMVYESVDQTHWTRVETFMHNDYPEMLDHDSGHHMGYVTYQGRPGKYYKAYVCIWAGSETDGDSRYIWTPIEYAAPF